MKGLKNKIDYDKQVKLKYNSFTQIVDFTIPFSKEAFF